MMNFSKHADSVRLYKSDIKASEVEKIRRKRKTKDRAVVEEAAIEEEGLTYGPGEF